MRSKILEEILNETPEDVKIFVDWYADLLININRILDKKGISQKQLAQQLDKSPSEISKWLHGEQNFTLRSLAKLQAELGEILLEIPKPLVTQHFDQKISEKTIEIVSPISIELGKKIAYNWQTVFNKQAEENQIELRNVG